MLLRSCRAKELCLRSTPGELCALQKTWLSDGTSAPVCGNSSKVPQTSDHSFNSKRRNSYAAWRTPGQTPVRARPLKSERTDQTSRCHRSLVAASEGRLVSAARTARLAQSGQLGAETPSARNVQSGSTPGSGPGRGPALGWDQRAGADLG